MTADLTPDDVAAIAAAEEAAEAAEEAAEAPGSALSRVQPMDLMWPITLEDKALHAAGLVVYLAERRLREEALESTDDDP